MWKDAYLTSRVLSADPIELVDILYEHAVQLVQDARCHLAAGDITSRSRSISRTILALAELEASLDHERGGSISRNLAQLYEYMRFRLTYANVKQEAEPLMEVEGLLKTLSEAWKTIRPAGNTGQVPPAAEHLDASPALPWAGQFTEQSGLAMAGHTWSA
jgi:flagellar protein FliS